MFMKFKLIISLFVKDLSLFVTKEYKDDINSIADSIFAWGFKLHEEETFPREDYRELLELTLVYL
jgi:hypothetical protein